MKTLLIVTSTLLVFGSLQGAVAESPQERLLRIEMDLASARAGGFGDRHPSVLASKAEIEALEKTPGVRDEEYQKLAKSKEALLKTDLATLVAAGFGSAHPERRKIEAQMNALPEAQARADAKSEAIRIEPGAVYTLNILGVPATENERWKRDYMISDAGNIHVPMIDRIKVVGLTIREAEKLIEASLKEHKIFTAIRVLLEPTKHG